MAWELAFAEDVPRQGFIQPTAMLVQMPHTLVLHHAQQTL